MAPIRIAIIGLSTTAKTSWAAGGHLPYLNSARGKERYQITALLNSSVDAAKRAIAGYDLGPDVKPYGSPQDLAADADIDLCATRVDVHYDTIKPSIAAGKAVFVEWPLAENVQRASELADLAKEKHVDTIVGVQGRVAPPIVKVKELLHAGTIGKVLSSELYLAAPFVERGRVSEGLGYFLDKKVGGNPVSIGFAHTIDSVHHILGEYKKSSSHTQIQRPQHTIYNKEAGTERSATSDVPDLVNVVGTLQPSTWVAEGASLVATYRVAPPFPGTPPFSWILTGETGEIRLSAPKTSFVNFVDDNAAAPIAVHDFATGEVKAVEWKWDEFLAPLSIRGRNIGKLYDLYYDGKLKDAGAADFASAVVRHREIDGILWP